MTAAGSGSWIDGSAFNYTNWNGGFGAPTNGKAAQVAIFGRNFPLTSPGKWFDSAFLQSGIGIRGLVCAHSP